jgi:hypothetical protein
LRAESAERLGASKVAPLQRWGARLVDIAGDPDDLFQLAHHVLSPTAEIAFVIASPVPTDDNGGQIGSIERGVVAAQALLDLLDSNLPVIGGSKDSLMAVSSSQPSAAGGAIVREAMRDDTELPLFVALGGGLTELASAYLIEPRIGGRLTAIWIGGPEYAGRSGAHAVARR